MTEFTITGNLNGVDANNYVFFLNEGKNLFTIHTSKDCSLIEELLDVRDGARIRVTGIILRDRENNKEIFVCRKATMLLGDDKTIQFVGNK